MGERVGSIVDLHQAVEGDVSISLGRRQADVSQKLLNATEIGTRVQEVRRAAMPKRMRMHITTPPREDAVTAHRVLNLPSREPCPEAPSE